MLPDCQTLRLRPNPSLGPDGTNDTKRMGAGCHLSVSLRFRVFVAINPGSGGYLISTSVPGFTASTMVFSGIESSSM